MAKQYLVTNPSSASICIVGRRRLEIPGQCEKHPCAFSGDEEAKATIAKLKRRYPMLKFEPMDGNTEEASVPAHSVHEQKESPVTPSPSFAPSEAKPESKPDKDSPAQPEATAEPATPVEVSSSDSKAAAKRNKE